MNHLRIIDYLRGENGRKSHMCGFKLDGMKGVA